MKQVIMFILLLTGVQLSAQTKADDIVGTWVTAGKEPARIQIYKSTEKYYGKIVWLQNPVTNGKPKVDSKNPDENKRGQQILGLLILQNFKFDNNEWSDGNIYDPQSGKTYSCNITLDGGNTLKVRGYVGIPAFGRTETWTRYSL
jgi:uncharacterized protein (DUF2147 family)